MAIIIISTILGLLSIALMFLTAYCLEQNEQLRRLRRDMLNGYTDLSQKQVSLGIIFREHLSKLSSNGYDPK